MKNVINYFQSEFHYKQSLYRFECRAKELTQALVCIDPKYPEVMRQISDDRNVLFDKISDIVDILMFQFGCSKEDFYEIFEKTGVQEWERHWFYPYLEVKDPWANQSA